MADLYANENFPLPVVGHLREFGHDVLTSLEAGTANQQISDEEVLAFAVRKKRTLITHNRGHFKRLHRKQPAHEGIIICTKDTDFLALAARVDSSIRENEPLTAKLVSVVKPPS
jgi:predicted nuclease of predicted toxin-antitoxin system